jgi:hypothetical protein
MTRRVACAPLIKSIERECMIRAICSDPGDHLIKFFQSFVRMGVWESWKTPQASIGAQEAKGRIRVARGGGPVNDERLNEWQRAGIPSCICSLARTSTGPHRLEEHCITCVTRYSACE